MSRVRRSTSRQRFGRTVPVVLEVGFGYGDATVELAVAEPDVDVIAVDVHTPGVAGVLDAIDRRGLRNLRLVHGDAVVFLDRVPAASLAGIRVFFPDPWPKVRQRHRRLIRPDTIGPFVERLAVGGVLHLATDIDDYAAQMGEVCAGEPRLTPVPAPWRPSTRYELKGADAGRHAIDLAWARSLPETGRLRAQAAEWARHLPETGRERARAAQRRGSQGKRWGAPPQATVSSSAALRRVVASERTRGRETSARSTWSSSEKQG